eukprot:TRINITY_DN63813_c0_g1_i1.p1 TRINITY_DN63813_c0_g1~~TRINITY_DN63813_c0_g1_i1.p1  ORF type:complete len:413 (-),score=69.38 TRINITY_DN63813_c0_g1_i1:120-1262(-)
MGVTPRGGAPPRPKRDLEDCGGARDCDVVVIFDAKWNVQALEALRQHGRSLGSSLKDVKPFFAEAKVSDDKMAVLRRRFEVFCSRNKDISDEPYFTFDNFHNFNAEHDVCKPSEEAHFFRALDRRKRHYLVFDDLLLGCVAASTSTPHILNSFTGYIRAHYIFDYFNASRSGYLDYEEIARLVSELRISRDGSSKVRDSAIRDMVQDMGDFSVVTLRIWSVGGVRLGDIRASTRWTGLQVRRELALSMELAPEAQQLFIGSTSLREDALLESVLPDGATSVDVQLVRSSWVIMPATPSAIPMERVSGVERLMHVTFERFYQALWSEKLRGTSRLFRFHRNVLHGRPRSHSHKSSGSIASGHIRHSSGAFRGGVSGAVGGA